MIDPLSAFVLLGATVAVAYGVATFPRKARELLAAIVPKPAAEAALIAQAQSEFDDYRWLDSQRFAYARDEDGYLDPSLLAPCDEALLYGHFEHEHEGFIHGR
ncbi:hypothetical protein [Stenotrophomonas indicatrix]|uniref:hypothetical protein n=1 Tax=Stenotrophomonas indicatrix TaxID=2045451 RepID=UPI0008B77BA1|nr:hypothetical protein [Stenotrophomonas indicatrix]SET25040.1 hypothetical protein SAMN05720615_103125 [Stenotrophomonas indicatrix]